LVLPKLQPVTSQSTVAVEVPFEELSVNPLVVLLLTHTVSLALPDRPTV
jgi:hypothetical protein